MAPVGATLIQWLGHACFMIAAVSGVHILVDPVSPKVGYPVTPHSIAANVIFVSHDHYDHNYIDLAVVTDPPANVVKPRTTPGYADGIYKFADANGKNRQFEFRRIFSYHDAVDGKLRGTNTITTFHIDGLHICHLGDLGQPALTPTQLKLIGPVDVLMIPVGGYYTIDGKTAAHIVAQLHPKVIIPMHFRTQYVNEDLQRKLAPIDLFIAALGNKVDVLAGGTSKLEISPNTLPDKPTVIKFSL